MREGETKNRRTSTIKGERIGNEFVREGRGESYAKAKRETRDMERENEGEE